LQRHLPAYGLVVAGDCARPDAEQIRVLPDRARPFWRSC
jgi:hypothetical protein